MSQVFLYDTTLRDGTQREDISLSVDDKLAIAKRLADFSEIFPLTRAILTCNRFA